jgi:hypothetical protein
MEAFANMFKKFFVFGVVALGFCSNPVYGQQEPAGRSVKESMIVNPTAFIGNSLQVSPNTRRVAYVGFSGNSR